MLQFDDPINIQFTSGTTGFPKGATLTHHNVLNNGFFVGEAIRLTEQDRLCIPVPLYHCFGMVMGNLACLTHGAAMVYPSEGFDPARRAACRRDGTLHRHLRRPDHVHRRARPSRFRRLRPVKPAHRHHGGLAVSDRGHAARHRPHASARGHHRLRHDGDQPGQLPERGRRPRGKPRRDGRPRAPPSRGQDHRRRGSDRAPAAPPASCALAAIR